MHPDEQLSEHDHFLQQWFRQRGATQEQAQRCASQLKKRASQLAQIRHTSETEELNALLRLILQGEQLSSRRKPND